MHGRNLEGDPLGQLAKSFCRESTVARESKGTTKAGFQNRNDQVNLGRTDPPLPGNDHLQLLYRMKCLDCGHRYHANGSDIWLRKCSSCQGGRPDSFRG